MGYIGDKLVNDLEPKDRGIAMVFQNYALYPHMTVFENIAFGLRLRKTPAAEMKRKVNEAAEILELDDLLGRKPKELSGGQRQRVALGRAIVRRPSAFLLDEPLSNLDAQLRTAMRAEISKLHKNLGATFVYVTHDQIEAMTMGDRIVVMKDGKIQQTGTPEDVYYRPANVFVARFIGTPAINLIGGVIEKKGAGHAVRSANGVFSLPVGWNLSKYVNSPVIIGVRPEDIRISGYLDPDDDFVIDARLELTEMLGPEMYLHASAAGGSLICKVSAGNGRPESAHLKLSVDRDRLLLFGADDELLIPKF